MFNRGALATIIEVTKPQCMDDTKKTTKLVHTHPKLDDFIQ